MTIRGHSGKSPKMRSFLKREAESLDSKKKAKKNNCRFKTVSEAIKNKTRK